jgi:branched-chain amino acid transport system permease protein
VNLACGSFYALGAYFGISALAWAAAFEVSAIAYIPILVGSGLLLAIVLGPSVERLLRLIYDRDEHFQILLTFALVLIFEDAIRLIWGAVPLQTINVYFAFGELRIASDLAIPNYNLIVIAAAALISAAFGWMLRRTRFGRIVRATAENKQMSEALCVDVSKVYMAVFTLGVALGTVGGALVVPAGAASIDMGVELIVDAFAVVIIGGLGSMPGALIGALIVGFVRSAAIWLYPEFELLAIYVIVITVLIVRPQGLLARTA